MTKFGTDGIRGRVGTEITPEVAMRLGAALVGALATEGRAPTIAIGRDSRPSGAMLEAACIAGICGAGGDAVLLGELPTAGVSAAIRSGGWDGGVMVTASHNPPGDNGIKAMDRRGHKLTGELRERVEALLNVAPTWSESTGGVTVERGSSLGYRVAILDALAGREGAKWLAGNRVVIDTANGAGTLHASRVLEALGAEVVAIGDGEGDRINEGCGALHPEAMVEAVRTHGAIAGIGLDGDGDRIAVCDATGRVLDGDAILWLCATDPTRDVGDVVVGTVMTNGGLEVALAARGIRMVRTPVGDTHVAEEMRRIGAKLGGEPSGHILFADGLPTADGLLAGLRALHPDPATLSERLAGLTLHPQVHAAVKVGRDRIPRCEAEIASLRQAGARVIVRGSGTEPVVRVMVEYPDLQVAAAGRDRLVALLEA